MRYLGKRTWRFQLILFGALLLGACAQGETAPVGPHAVTVRWEASPAAAVNRPGGGYIVYWGRQPDFLPEQAVDSIRVEYDGGELAPTSATVEDLGSGTWYFRVVAFSALGGGQTSDPSGSFQVELP